MVVGTLAEELDGQGSIRMIAVAWHREWEVSQTQLMDSVTAALTSPYYQKYCKALRYTNGGPQRLVNELSAAAK